jgi:hypothetical protein
MLGMTFNVAKSNFFDRDRVKDVMDKATRQALVDIGSYVRKVAQRSLRYRNRPSAPGKPPHAHRSMSRMKRNRKTGAVKRQMVSPLREFIFFAYDAARKTVVVGPALLNGRNGSLILSSLEYGGPSIVMVGGKGRRIMVRARPFMRPALAIGLENLKGRWKNSFVAR